MMMSVRELQEDWQKKMEAGRSFIDKKGIAWKGVSPSTHLKVMRCCETHLFAIFAHRGHRPLMQDRHPLFAALFISYSIIIIAFIIVI